MNYSERVGLKLMICCTNNGYRKEALVAAMPNMLAALAYLHQLHGVAPDEVLDVTVTCDGTWSYQEKIPARRKKGDLHHNYR